MAQHFSLGDDIDQVFAYTFRLYTYFNDRQAQRNIIYIKYKIAIFFNNITCIIDMREI